MGVEPRRITQSFRAAERCTTRGRGVATAPLAAIEGRLAHALIPPIAAAPHPKESKVLEDIDAAHAPLDALVGQCELREPRRTRSPSWDGRAVVGNTSRLGALGRESCLRRREPLVLPSTDMGSFSVNVFMTPHPEGVGSSIGIGVLGAQLVLCRICAQWDGPFYGTRVHAFVGGAGSRRWSPCRSAPPRTVSRTLSLMSTRVSGASQPQCRLRHRTILSNLAATLPITRVRWAIRARPPLRRHRLRSRVRQHAPQVLLRFAATCTAPSAGREKVPKPGRLVHSV